jgi:DNA-binding response OmpR family regulator
MRVLEAQDGHEALDLAANNNPDFVFMDVDMPGISGIETCRRLRAREDSEDTPILIVTGADDQETIDLGFEAGATQYITKPLNWPLLGRLVKYMLRSPTSRFLSRESVSRVSAPVAVLRFVRRTTKRPLASNPRLFASGSRRRVFKDLMKRRRMRLPSLLMSVAMPRQFDCSLTRAVSCSGCS